MAALHEAFGLVEDDAGDFDVAFGGFVEGRGDYFGVDAALHVGDFFGTFVDEENRDVGLGWFSAMALAMSLSRSGLAGLGRGHYEAALAFAYGGEHVDHARGERATSGRR